MPTQPETDLSDKTWWELPTKALSATLVILFDSPEGPRVLLTVRSLKLKHYPGDTALPGGRAENSEDWWATALREAYEEIGFDPEHFECERLAAMPAHLSAHLLLVRPVVCKVSRKGPASGYITVQDIAPNLSGDEVACAYSLPLEWFLERNNLRAKQVICSEWLGNEWNFFVFKVPKSQEFIFADQDQEKAFKGTTVVGLTAHIMVDVARWYFEKLPDFEHFEHLGNQLAVETAVRDGLFGVHIPKV